MRLNSIGPAVAIGRRGDAWCVRFRLPAELAEKHSLPCRPRLTSSLPPNVTHDRLVREANRIGAMLDMLLRGKDAPANGQSLAGWLGLPEPAKRRSRRERGKVEPTTWSDLVALYAEDFKANSRARELNQRQRIGRLDKIAAAFESMPDDITPKNWTEWLTSLDAGSPGKNEYRSIIRTVYRFGITKFACTTNPIEAVARFRRPHSTAPCYRTQAMIAAELDMRPHSSDEQRAICRYRVLDEQEQSELIELHRERDPEFLPCVVLGLHGVSGIDVRMARQPSYVDGVFSGRRSKTGNASFSVPIAPALQHILDKHWLKVRREEWAFPWVHSVKDGKTKFLHRWAHLIRGSGFDGLGFHALRHSFVSLMLSRGVGVEIVGQWVGHLDRNTTATVYNHFLKTESVSVMAKLRLFEAV